METLNNLNLSLLLVGIAVISIGILGFVVFFSNPKNATHRAFLFLTGTTILWSIFNYINSWFASEIIVLWLWRVAMFFAIWHAFSIYYLFYVFPREKVEYSWKFKFVVIPIVLITSLLCLSPFVFSRIAELAPVGSISKTAVGYGIYIFGLVAGALLGRGVYLLFQKIRGTIGAIKAQIQYILFGVLVTFSLIFFFNFILPGIFLDVRFIPLAPIFFLPFIAFTAYAIIKHQLFNVKVIATELLVFTIWIIILIELLTKTSWGERILEGFIFFFMVIFGILLIRSVRQEVSKRLQFELLSKELAVANDKLKELDDLKTDFISIASHQLRTPLTAIKGYSSMILEGTYGESPIKIKGAVDKIFQSAQRLIYIVNDLLDISRIEQGKFTLTLEDVKVANVLKDVVEELKPNAQKNNLDLSFVVAVDDAEIKIKADFGKIRQVFSNLIDNAIKYTPSGFVKVEFKSNGNNALISISDSGVGMSEVTIKNLFQKFSRAKGIAKMHTDGSGLGLYVAKQIIDAHHGRVWAESDGEDKGSRFLVELPIGGFQN